MWVGVQLEIDNNKLRTCMSWADLDPFVTFPSVLLLMALHTNEALKLKILSS